ncbi:tetratricopeptide repeat protein [Anaerobacillus sp. MEB173]|uniref:tetratricopeptide repeat protein n=1 Tax=Anaerobacillus sp. MEB173 TaxID=3383345 RepID=UPI003F8D930B
MDKWLNEWQSQFEHVKKQWKKNNQINKTQLNKLIDDTEFVLETWMEMEDKIADLKEAVEEEETVPRTKLYSKTYQSVGTVYFSIDMFERSIKEFEKDLLNGCGEPEIHLYLGYAYLYTRNYDKAKEHFLFLLQLPQSKREKHFAYVGLGLLYGQQQEVEQAIHFFEKALSVTGNVDVVYNLGICYLLLQRPQLSLPYFKKVIELLPEDAEGYYFLGHCYMKIGEEAKAFEVWYTALQLIEYKDLLVTLAYEFEQYGHYLVAVHCYKRLLALGFNDIWVQHGIAWNYGLLDEKDKALDLFKNLLNREPYNQNLWISFLWLLSKWNEQRELTTSIAKIKEQELSHPLIDKILACTH